MDRQPYGVQPLGIGDILRQTATIYRDHFTTVVRVAAVVLVPVVTIQILLTLVIENSDDMAASFLLSIIGAVIDAGASAAVIAVVTTATAQIVLNGRTSMIDAFDYSASRIIPALKATYLLAFLLILIAITVIGIPIAIFLAIAWFVTIQVVVLENVGSRFALGRSWELTRNNRLRVLGSTLLVVIITGFMLLLFELPGIAIELRALIRGDEYAAPTYAWMLTAAFSSVGAILITPMQYCAWTLLYFNLRARNDALPVEHQPDPYSPSPAPLPNMD